MLTVKDCITLTYHKLTLLGRDWRIKFPSFRAMKNMLLEVYWLCFIPHVIKIFTLKCEPKGSI